MTDKEIEIENKRYELAEQEYKNMDGAEIIDFLFNKIYAKMSDNEK
tara:strand:- start:2798 stop:2935 length:138 start_codon:yes stop_codon:yes gene_type:complete